MRDYHALIVKEMKRRYFYHADTRATCLELANIATSVADLGKYDTGKIVRATVEAWRYWNKCTNLDADFVTYACICTSTIDLLSLKK